MKHLRPRSRFGWLVASIVCFAAIVLLVIGSVQLGRYITRPHIRYSIKTADCGQAAISARNQAAESDLRSCVLVLSATNLKRKITYVNYNGVGFSGGSPLIQIFSSDGKFCYAITNELTTFQPYQTQDLTLQCSPEAQPSRNYDNNADSHPDKIVINGYGGATLPVNPKQ